MKTNNCLKNYLTDIALSIDIELYRINCMNNYWTIDSTSHLKKKQAIECNRYIFLSRIFYFNRIIDEQFGKTFFSLNYIV